jgi:geranylgeranyl pyrophosphate synthase
MDSRNYNAVNSQRLIQGESNTYTDSSVNIGQSFNEKQERIAALDDVIEKLKASEAKDELVDKAQRELSKVRDELAEYPEPNKSSVKKWLEFAKNALTTSILGYEATEAVKKLWELFGV